MDCISLWVRTAACVLVLSSVNKAVLLAADPSPGTAMAVAQNRASYPFKGLEHERRFTIETLSERPSEPFQFNRLNPTAANEPFHFSLLPRALEQGAGTNRIYIPPRSFLMAAQAQSPEKPEPGIPSAGAESDTRNDTSGTRNAGLDRFGGVSPFNYQPLTGKQRWHHYLKHTFMSHPAYLSPLWSALFEQMSGSPTEWGGGMEGYGRRLASRAAMRVVRETTKAAGCAILGQEPRYVRSSSSSIPSRIAHAFLAIFFTYNNEGKRRIAFASLGAYYASSMLATQWYPERYTALGDGVRSGNRRVLVSGAVNQLKEFWPEIKRHVLRQK